MEDLVCNLALLQSRQRNYLRDMTGELETTLFERMCMIQKLRGLISSCALMENRLKPFTDRLESYLNPIIKGTVLEDLAPHAFRGEECYLEQGVLRCLQELLTHTGRAFDVNIITGRVQATQYTKFVHHGSIFSPSSFSVRDSHVIIGKGIPGDWYAGKVIQIFTLGSASEPYFVVQRFKELSVQEAQQDPYRRYPLVAGRLYHPELEDETEVVTLQELIAHFAHTPHDSQTFGFPCFHALPLNKVSHFHYFDGQR